MAGANKINQIETGDISEVNEIDSSTIVGISGIEASFLTVPIGLILPFNDTSIPAGWERFTSADNRHIVGAGDSYSPGSAGGNVNVSSINVASSSAGSHTGSPTFTGRQIGSTFGYANPPGEISSGDHSHIIDNGDYNPLANNILLIKALEDLPILPTNSVLLSSGTMNNSGLTNVMNNSRFLRSSSSISTSGSTSMTAATSASGGHIHYAAILRDNTPGSSALPYEVTGGGTHGAGNVSLTVSETIRRVQLSAWSHASQEIEMIPNMIGMYESLTPPDGWFLCNGSNGTPDLRNYFVKTVSGGSESSGSGNDQIHLSGSGSLNHSASHAHKTPASGVWNIVTSGRLHDTYAWSHGHSYSVNNTYSYLPRYYALSFIMKIA